MVTPTRRCIRHRGLQLSYLDSAPEQADRPVVLLIHGFPDTAEMWTAQISGLHASGYRVIAPDTVGCGHSDMAPTRHDYLARRICVDLTVILDQVGADRVGADSVHVVGHDWGAVIAWFLAGYHPERVRTLTVMSVGHPTAYARAEVSQRIAGWYVFLFCIPGLSERVLTGRTDVDLAKHFGGYPDLDGMLARFSEPGRAEAAMRIYRANVAPVLFRRHPAVSAPTLGLWSVDDPILVESQMVASRRYVTGSWRYERLAGSHWIPQEQPEVVTALLLEHLSQDGTGGPHG